MEQPYDIQQELSDDIGRVEAFELVEEDDHDLPVEEYITVEDQPVLVSEAEMYQQDQDDDIAIVKREFEALEGIECPCKKKGVHLIKHVVRSQHEEIFEPQSETTIQVNMRNMLTFVMILMVLMVWIVILTVTAAVQKQLRHEKDFVYAV